MVGKGLIRHSLLLAEATVLLLATYFFWFISSFPYDRAETGIIRAEWAWVVLLLGAMLLVYGAVHLRWWGRWPPWVRWGGAALLWCVVPLSLLLAPAPSYAIDRQDWFGLLACLLPFYVLRLWRLPQRPIWTWYAPWFVAFVVLCAIAVLVTPDITGYPSRGWGMLARPVLGLAWVIFFIDVVQVTGRLDGVLHVLIGFGLLLGYYALTATQWDLSKSTFFEGIIVRLDTLPDLAPFATLNPNEVGGVMVWLLPAVGAAVMYPLHRFWRVLALVATVMMALALLVGQSRSALLGLGLSTVLIAGGLMIAGRVRAWVIGAVAVVSVVVVVGSLFVLQGGGLSDRDQTTTAERFAYWESAFAIIRDYPLTGVGMNMYRDFSFPNPETGRTVRQDYPVDGQNIYPPHAHNEFVQITTDLGVPGLLVFVAFYAVSGAITWRVWRLDNGYRRWMAGAFASGLIAHAVYGMMDAIPVWDRFAVVLWMTFGGLAAVGALISGKNIQIECNYSGG